MQSRQEVMRQAFKEMEVEDGAPLLEELTDNTERQRRVERIFILVAPPPPPELVRATLKKLLLAQIMLWNRELKASLTYSACRFCGGHHK